MIFLLITIIECERPDIDMTNMMIRLTLAIAFLVTAIIPASAEDRVPVTWSSDINALWDDGVVKHQSEFARLYATWPASLKFSGSKGIDAPPTTVTFHSCPEIIKISDAWRNEVWPGSDDLANLQFWTQASNCKLWPIVAKLGGSKESYLPQVFGAGKATAAVSFMHALVEKIVKEKKRRFKGKFLSEMDLQEGWDVECNTWQCSYQVLDEDSDADNHDVDNYDVYVLDIVAQGDYNHDGINDFFITVLAPKIKSGYLGLIVTRRKAGGPIEILGEY